MDLKKTKEKSKEKKKKEKEREEFYFLYFINKCLKYVLRIITIYIPHSAKKVLDLFQFFMESKRIKIATCGQQECLHLKK